MATVKELLLRLNLMSSDVHDLRKAYDPVSVDPTADFGDLRLVARRLQEIIRVLSSAVGDICEELRGYADTVDDFEAETIAIDMIGQAFGMLEAQLDATGRPFGYAANGMAAVIDARRALEGRNEREAQ